MPQQRFEIKEKDGKTGETVKMRGPNLIYIFADQLRYFSMGYAGDQNAQTPNLDAFCAESTDLCRPFPDIRCARPIGHHFLPENIPPAREW